MHASEREVTMSKYQHLFFFLYHTSGSQRVGNEEVTALVNSPPLKGVTCLNVMTWLAELKPNTALNHRGVVDGSRERKGARRQRFLIQINTEPHFSSKPLLSIIDCSSMQWLFQHALGKRVLQIYVPRFFLFTPNIFLISIWELVFLLFIYSHRISPFWSHLFTAPSLTVSRFTTSPCHRGAHS